MGEGSLRLCPSMTAAAAAAEEAELIGKESVIVMEMTGTQPAAEAEPAFETHLTEAEPVPGARQSDCPNDQCWFWDGGNKRV